MKERIAILTVSVVALAGAAALWAQAAPATADSKRLEMWTGVWQYEGAASATPLGPAAKISGRQTGRLIANGLALEWSGEEDGPFGPVKWGEVLTYDPVTKGFAFLGSQSDGASWSGTGTQGSASWKWTGTFIGSKGVPYRYRNETAFSADGTSVRWKNEISVDNRTWLPFTQGTMKRIKPLAQAPRSR